MESVLQYINRLNRNLESMIAVRSPNLHHNRLEISSWYFSLVPLGWQWIFLRQSAVESVWECHKAEEGQQQAQQQQGQDNSGNGEEDGGDEDVDAKTEDSNAITLIKGRSLLFKI